MYCPMIRRNCASDCAWLTSEGCAISVIASELTMIKRSVEEIAISGRQSAYHGGELHPKGM